MSQVEPTAASLNTNDVFVLKNQQSVYLWKGKGKTDEEMTTAMLLVKKLWKGAKVVELEETQEPCEPLRNSFFKCLQDDGVGNLSRTTVFVFLSAEFWEALGGKGAYQTSVNLSKSVHLPRLFACSNKTGRLIVRSLSWLFQSLQTIYRS